MPDNSQLKFGAKASLALAVLEGDYLRPLAQIDPVIAADVAMAAAGRRMPPVTSGFVGQSRY